MITNIVIKIDPIPVKMQVFDSKSFNRFATGHSIKNAGAKNAGDYHYVVENKCIKNVRKRPHHYTDENKGPMGL
jgi:hypothetical protein